MVVLCANVYCPPLSNAPPCSETNDKTTPASTDSYKEPILPMHGYGLSRPNGRHHKDILLQDCAKEHIPNSENGLHHDPRH